MIFVINSIYFYYYFNRLRLSQYYSVSKVMYNVHGALIFQVVSWILYCKMKLINAQSEDNLKFENRISKSNHACAPRLVHPISLITKFQSIPINLFK